MSNKAKKITLALGADIKNKALITNGREFYYAPAIGDLENSVNYKKFKSAVKALINKIGAKPAVIAHDLHPGYFSTRFARQIAPELKAELIPVQHHYAHLGSVMQGCASGLPFIGISFDGTGFGTDGNMWGGEFVVIEPNTFHRVAHLKYLKMPGGDRVINEPWRMLLSILGKNAAPFLKKVKKRDLKIAMSLMAKSVNSPLTSSAGRLFDAAAALLGVCLYASYEAEGPIKLEKMAWKNINESYDPRIVKKDNVYTIDMKPVFLGMARDLKNKIGKSLIAGKFHNSVVRAIIKMTEKISDMTGIKNIALSGGVFQNKLLKDKTVKMLMTRGFGVYITEPVNDYNIALGQYYVSGNSRQN